MDGGRGEREGSGGGGGVFIERREIESKKNSLLNFIFFPSRVCLQFSTFTSPLKEF